MSGPDTTETDFEYQKTLYEAYKVERAAADEVALTIGDRYEKMLSLVAGGALAVSVTFIEKIAPSPTASTRWIALLGWLLLSISLLATLIAIEASQRAQQRKIENLDNGIQQKMYPEDEEFKKIDTSSNPHTSTVVTANYISLRCAIFGLLCLVAFAFLNFPSGRSKEEAKTENNSAKVRQPQSPALVVPISNSTNLQLTFTIPSASRKNSNREASTP